MLHQLKMHDRILRNEENIAKHINIIGHYADDTLIDKSDKLIKIIKLTGLDFITQDEQMLDIYKNRRNNLFKSFSSDFAFYIWDVRRKYANYPVGEFPEGFAKEVNEKYRQKILQTEMYHNDLYLAVITKQPEGFFNKGLNFLKQFNYFVDKNAKQQYLAKRYQELNEVTTKLLSALADYKPELLSVFDKNGVQISAPLSFYHY